MPLDNPTPNLLLERPDFNVVTWHDQINNNFTKLDTAIAAVGAIIQWTNSTTYPIGAFVISPQDATLWMNNVAHTSAASPITFSDDRTANPTYWTLFIDLIDEFGDLYLGSKVADPTLDNDGNPLQTGALYYNTTFSAMMVYTGAVWTSFSGSTNFLALTDTPNSYTGEALRVARVNAGETGLEFATGAQSTAALDVFTPALKGLAPASGGGPTNFLRADGTWTAPPGAGSTTLLALTDTPSSYANFGSRGPAGAAVRVNDAQNAVEFKWSTAEYIDIRDYDETLTTNSDFTVALQAAVDDYANHLCRTYRIPFVGNGVLFWDPALNSFPTTVGADIRVSYILEFACTQVKLKSQFALRNGMTVRGVTTSTSANFLSQPMVLPLFTNEASVGNNVALILMAGQSLIEHISAASTGGPALGAFGTNLFTIRDCRFSTEKNSDFAIDINVCFWITMERVFAQSGPATVVGAIGFNNGTTDVGTGGGGTDCGLVRCKELRLGRSGIHIGAQLGPVGSRNMIFEDVLCENTIANRDLFTLDTVGGSAFVGHIKIIRPEFADSIVPGTNYWLSATSRGLGSIYDVYVEGPAVNHVLRPTSDLIKNLVINQEIPSSVSVSGQAITSVYAGSEGWMNWSRETPISLNKKLLTAPVGVPWVPGTPLAVIQNPASWTQGTSGATITAGILAPDGSTLAGRVSGGGGARCLNVSQTVAVGDWIIGGVWMRASTGAALSTRDARVSVTGTGTFQTNGTSGMLKFNNFDVADGLTADGWRWFSCAYKVTAIGTNPATIIFTLSGNGGTNCDFFNPCLILIPTGTIDDEWALTIARSLKGGWNSSASAGDVGFLDHQRLFVGSGGMKVNSGYVDVVEMVAPSNPPANTVRLFSRDNGSGKTQLCAIFPTGGVLVVGEQP